MAKDAESKVSLQGERECKTDGVKTGMSESSHLTSRGVRPGRHHDHSGIRFGTAGSYEIISKFGRRGKGTPGYTIK